MQVIEEQRKLIFYSNELESFREEIERSFAKLNLKEQEKAEKTKLFTELKTQSLLIQNINSQNIPIEYLVIVYTQCTVIAINILKITEILKQIGKKEASKKIRRRCSLLAIEIIISVVQLISKVSETIKIEINNSKVETIEKQIIFLDKINNIKIIKESLRIQGFTNIDRYLSAVIGLNQQVLKAKNEVEKSEGFNNDQRDETLKIINQFKSQIKYLIKNSLDIFRKKDNDKKIIIDNVQWEEYENIIETIGEVSWCRISYLDGVLEFVTISERHEIINRYIAELINDYFCAKEIGYIPVGSTTYKIRKDKKGKEADSAYKFTEARKYPDFAVEVNFSSGGVASLEIFKDFQTKEVWMWDGKDNLKFYILKGSEYIESNTSLNLTNVTPGIIRKYVQLVEKDKLKIYKYKKEFINEVAANIIESSS
ncbi:MAG: hypothetical protein AAGA80_17685 [Cyanobacteria bacterium P01_F01_bin.143]